MIDAPEATVSAAEVARPTSCGLRDGRAQDNLVPGFRVRDILPLDSPAQTWTMPRARHVRSTHQDVPGETDAGSVVATHHPDRSFDHLPARCVTRDRRREGFYRGRARQAA